MIVKQVRLSQQAKDQLSRLKGKTGIKNWNILCRAWCLRMELPADDPAVAKYFRLNLERGIAHLCGTGLIRSLDDLLELAVKQ